MAAAVTLSDPLCSESSAAAHVEFSTIAAISWMIIGHEPGQVFELYGRN